jgi:hypothetical protein
MATSYARRLAATSQRAAGPVARQWIVVAQILGLALGLILCYFSTIPPLKVLGVLLFGLLALQRIDLALLFVPLTVPLFLMQLRLPGMLPHAVPPHELVLFLCCAAAGFIALPSAIGGLFTRTLSGTWRLLRSYAPELILLVAGVFGIWYTAPESVAQQDALRAFRWFVAEPLLFVALAQFLVQRQIAAGQSAARALRPLLLAFVAGGAAVGLLALAEFAGALLAPQLFSRLISLDFSGDVLNRMPRATSVYTNPNNLGLFLGRVWPLAMALLLIERRTRTGRALLYGAITVLCLGGMLVSFSRGAWLGAAAAAVVLGLPWLRRRFHAWLLPGLLFGGTLLCGVAALMLTLRGGLAGASASARLMLWREALELLHLHPFGVGLDQFYYYHNPVFGRSLIDPSLVHGFDQYAHQPHTFVLELWLNLGPLGVLAMALIVLRAAIYGWALVRSQPGSPEARLVHGALAALAAALVHGLVDTFYFWPDLAFSFWLLVLLVRAYAEPWPALASQPALAQRHTQLLAAEPVAARQFGGVAGWLRMAGHNLVAWLGRVAAFGRGANLRHQADNAGRGRIAAQQVVDQLVQVGDEDRARAEQLQPG